MSNAADDYWDALCRSHRGDALEAVKRLREQGRTALEIVDEVIVPAQTRIGELWLDGAWSVDEEAGATAINEGLVHWLGSFEPHPGSDRPLVLVSCLEGERHALPALVVAESLQAAGYRVTYVGGDPDPADLLRQILTLKPRAVLFSASLTSSLAAQRSLLASIRAIGIPVVVGGQAFGGDERRALALGATAFAPSVADAIRLMSELPVRLPPAQPTPPGPADVEAAWILEYRDEITPYVARSIAARHLRDGERPEWWPEFGSHVDHVLGCLASALVTGDETIMVEVREWLERVLAARHAVRGLVPEIWQLLGEPLRGHPLARVHLAGSAPRVGEAPGDTPGDIAGGRSGAPV